MSITQDKIESVKSGLDIVRVIGQYVDLKKRGAGYVGLCPFHQEKTPSFSVHPTKQMFKCFGCEAAGDVIAFEQKINRLTFVDAVKRLSSQANVELDEGRQHRPTRRVKKGWNPKPVKKHEPVDYIPHSCVDAISSSPQESNLLKYFSSIIDPHIASHQFIQYGGTGNNFKGRQQYDTIFWYVDVKGGVRTGKAFKYDPLTGKRDKAVPPLHVHGLGGAKEAILEAIGKDKFDSSPCLFGEWLLQFYPGCTVGLVESEKTAIICSYFLKDVAPVWLAVGGASGLNFKSNPKKFAPLKNHSVIMYPDADPDGKCFREWQLEAEHMRKKGFRVVVSDILENLPAQEKQLKLDIADYLLNQNIHTSNSTQQ